MGASPSLQENTVGGMLYTTQWIRVQPGASGSSTIKAKLLVPSGADSHTRAGEISSPSQVYFEGILSFSLKDGLVKCKLMSFCPCSNKKNNSRSRAFIKLIIELQFIYKLTHLKN
jgi:hypothetical protein